MNKLVSIGIVVVIVIAAYLVITVVMPTFTGIVNTVNSTLNSTSNMSNYPGTASTLVSTPLIMYFVPGIFGVALVVFILKRKEQ